MKSKEELLNLLKIVILSLKMENKSSPYIRIKDEAVSKFLQISNRDDVDISTNDIINLYGKMSDQDRSNVRYMFIITYTDKNDITNYYYKCHLGSFLISKSTVNIWGKWFCICGTIWYQGIYEKSCSN